MRMGIAESFLSCLLGKAVSQLVSSRGELAQSKSNSLTELIVAVWQSFSFCWVGYILVSFARPDSAHRARLGRTPAGTSRSKQFIYGFPGPSEVELKRLAEGNNTMKVSCRLLRAMLRAGIPAVLENPISLAFVERSTAAAFVAAGAPHRHLLL